MLKRSLRFSSALVVLAVSAACEKASPTRPTEVETATSVAASMTDARTGATLIAARPVTPANGAQVPYAQQPVTLTVSNAVSTGSAPVTYTFEVAGDANFARLDYSRADVAAGANGSTNLKLDTLGGSRQYFWRVRANLPSGAGPYSTVRSFTVGPEVVLGTPGLISPIDGAAAFAPLTLTLANVSRSGPAGAIRYAVDVASDSGFGAIVYTTTADEQGGGQTSITAAVSGLTAGSTYYWRARATDITNNITTPYSPAAAFVVQSFNFATAKMWDNPGDVGTWPVGARITNIEFTGFSMRVDFDRREGANRWPDVVPPGWAGALQYTLGMCRNIGGQWHCSAVVQFWYGRSLDETAPASRFWREWWYDGGRWGPLASNPPQEGETVGIFVAAGDLRQRGFTRDTCPRVCEVSNVVLVPFTSAYANYVF